MSNNNQQRVVSGVKCRLLDMLDEKSLEAMKKFGFVYRDKYTGKMKLRVYKK